MISGFSLYLVFKDVSLQDVLGSFIKADWRYIGLALVCVMLSFIAKTWRWRTLLGSKGKTLRIPNLFMNIVVGQLLNNIYPARVGDLSRAYLVGRQGPGGIFVLGTVIIEKVFDLLFYAVFFILTLLLIPLPGWIAKSAYSLTAITVLAILIVILLTLRMNFFLGLIEKIIKKLPSKYQAPILSRLEPGMASLLVLKSRWDLFKIMGISALIWGIAVLTNGVTLLALNLQLPWFAWILVLMLLQVGISIPSIPGNVGIFEYACVLALSFFAVGSAQALSFGILLHGIVLIPLIVFGLSFIWLMGVKPAIPAKL
ncbi:MAG: flippase-like domain-containing protein [Chloroflexi bacterium]|nr:flippase-like domain-containing protein [Chloroflexota bacterium]